MIDLFGLGPKPLFYVPQIWLSLRPPIFNSQIFTDFPGEGWVKGRAQPFTRTNSLATDIYAISVKSEECF
jgi:hypothetical protein